MCIPSALGSTASSGHGSAVSSRWRGTHALMAAIGSANATKNESPSVFTSQPEPLHAARRISAMPLEQHGVPVADPPEELCGSLDVGERERHQARRKRPVRPRHALSIVRPAATLRRRFRRLAVSRRPSWGRKVWTAFGSAYTRRRRRCRRGCRLAPWTGSVRPRHGCRSRAPSTLADNSRARATSPPAARTAARSPR